MITARCAGPRATTIADELDPEITDADLRTWSAGSGRDWAGESFDLGRQERLCLPVRPACAFGGGVALAAAYWEPPPG